MVRYHNSGTQKFDNVESDSVITDDTDSKRLSENYHYAGAYDGSDADARLDAAISSMTEGETVFLEQASYGTDRSISKGIAIVGTGIDFNTATNINGSWTVTGGNVIIRSVHINNGDVTVDNDEVLIIECRGENGSVTFNSGTSGGLVDSCVNVGVTDNGTNTVGNIS